MANETTPGVLLRGADGSYYFIPHTDLSGFKLEAEPSALTQAGEIASNVPRLDAFSVERVEGTPGESAAAVPMPEGGPEGAAAFLPMPEGGPEAPSAP